jgi:hypothetical protein
MQTLRFKLAIPTDEWLRYYRGEANKVITWAKDGRTVQLPASALRPFVTAEGIHGEFVMRIDANNKLIELRRA